MRFALFTSFKPMRGQACRTGIGRSTLRTPVSSARIVKLAQRVPAFVAWLRCWSYATRFANALPQTGFSHWYPIMRREPGAFNEYACIVRATRASVWYPQDKNDSDHKTYISDVIPHRYWHLIGVHRHRRGLCFYFPWPQKFTFWPQSIFYPLFLNEGSRIRKNRPNNCIIDFKDIQVWLRHFSLNLNACKVVTVFFKIPGKILKKTVTTLQALRFKLKCLNQTCISLKSIMQLISTFFSDSATFIENKRVENRLWPKIEFLWPKKITSYGASAIRQSVHRAQSRVWFWTLKTFKNLTQQKKLGTQSLKNSTPKSAVEGPRGMTSIPLFSKN